MLVSRRPQGCSRGPQAHVSLAGMHLFRLRASVLGVVAGIIGSPPFGVAAPLVSPRPPAHTPCGALFGCLFEHGGALHAVLCHPHQVCCGVRMLLAHLPWRAHIAPALAIRSGGRAISIVHATAARRRGALPGAFSSPVRCSGISPGVRPGPTCSPPPHAPLPPHANALPTRVPPRTPASQSLPSAALPPTSAKQCARPRTGNLDQLVGAWHCAAQRRFPPSSCSPVTRSTSRPGPWRASRRL